MVKKVKKAKTEKRVKALRKKCREKEFHVWDDVKNNCVKNIDTIEIFFKKPLIGSLAIALLAYFFAAFLFKIKGMPLAKSNSQDPTRGRFITCGTIATEKLLFTKDPLLGMVKSEAYNQNETNKYSKIFWPWLGETMYPSKPNRSSGEADGGASKGGQRGGDKEDDVKFASALSGGKLDFMYVLFIPFYISLKWTTQLYYSVLCIIKNTFYKADHWGSLGEINKINKKLWLSDLLVVFIGIPLLVFLVMPVLFVGMLVMSLVIAPVKSFAWNIQRTKHIREDLGDDSSIWERFVHYLKLVGWFFLYFMMGGVSMFMIGVLHILWFMSILMGQQETESDGIKTIIKTWANIIWDYKFIWAILAITLWLGNFRSYLSGESAKDLGVYQSSGFLSFITPKNREMILGVVGGATVVLLLLKQSKYYAKLSDKSPKSRNCTDDCKPPDGDDKDDKTTKKCKNYKYNPKSRFDGILGKEGAKKMFDLKAKAAEALRKFTNASKADNVLKAEREKKAVKDAAAKFKST